MPITLVRNQKESSERVLGKFNKIVQKSRVVMEARNRRYHSKPLTPRLIKQKALMREMYRAKREKMKFY